MRGVSAAGDESKWGKANMEEGGRLEGTLQTRYDPVGSKHFQCAKTTGLAAL